LSEDEWREIERIIEERCKELSKRLEDFERSLERNRITTRKIERERLVKKILEYVKQPPALQ
jgi:NADH:ubiquinone oxidoreductase subunit D